jgi:preprotein translocase subunit SecE
VCRTAATQGSGATGSAPVSKTGGWGFESLLPCGTTFPAPVEEAAAFDQVIVVTTSIRASAEPTPKPRRRGGLRLFLRQVVAELKKVVRPTRNELLTYTWVVLVFVLAVMAFVSVIDFGVGKLVLWAFSD